MNLAKKTLHCTFRSEKGEMGLNRSTESMYEFTCHEGNQPFQVFSLKPIANNRTGRQFRAMSE